jgi:hypothetical protein
MLRGACYKNTKWTSTEIIGKEWSWTPNQDQSGN